MLLASFAFKLATPAADGPTSSGRDTEEDGEPARRSRRRARWTRSLAPTRAGPRTFDPRRRRVGAQRAPGPAHRRLRHRESAKAVGIARAVPFARSAEY